MPGRGATRQGRLDGRGTSGGPEWLRSHPAPLRTSPVVQVAHRGNPPMKRSSSSKTLRLPLRSWMDRQDPRLRYEELATQLGEKRTTVQAWAAKNNWPDSVLKKLAEVTHGELFADAAEAKKLTENRKRTR